MLFLWALADLVVYLLVCVHVFCVCVEVVIKYYCLSFILALLYEQQRLEWWGTDSFECTIHTNSQTLIIDPVLVQHAWFPQYKYLHVRASPASGFSSYVQLWLAAWLLTPSVLPHLFAFYLFFFSDFPTVSPSIRVAPGDPQGSESESVNGPGRDSGLASSRLEPSATLPSRAGAESGPETMEGMLCRKQEMESHSKKAATRSEPVETLLLLCLESHTPAPFPVPVTCSQLYSAPHYPR